MLLTFISIDMSALNYAELEKAAHAARCACRYFLRNGAHFGLKFSYIFCDLLSLW